MAESYRISVQKDYLIFAAAHFITYDGQCEPLHGHNYRVEVRVEGELDDNAYVFDFVTLKRTMRALVNELDHRTLLPLRNPKLAVEETGRAVRAVYAGEREYLFPREDVVLLDIPNTTAEMLARHLTNRLLDELRLHERATLRVVEMGVEEAFGQWAWHRRDLRG